MKVSERAMGKRTQTAPVEGYSPARGMHVRIKSRRVESPHNHPPLLLLSRTSARGSNPNQDHKRAKVNSQEAAVLQGSVRENP